MTNGWLNTFDIALRATGVLKPNVLNGIDAYALMMLAILLFIFGPRRTVCAIVNCLRTKRVGKFLAYSYPMAIAIGLTSLYGFPGTLILSQEAVKNIGETEDEVQIIEDEILPKLSENTPTSKRSESGSILTRQPFGYIPFEGGEKWC